MKKKKIVLLIIAFSLIGGGWYAYSEFNRKVKDLSKVRADIELNSVDLISFFERNESVANVNYLDKIIAVKGRVRTIEKNEAGHYSVILGDESSMSSVRCSMDSSHLGGIVDVPEGAVVTIKGACTGFNSNELLGSDVILNRCVLNN